VTASRPEPDPVARWIAATVQHHLITSPAERPDLPALPDGVTAVEAHAVGELDAGVVVTTADRGVRYFLVRVSEFTTR
jgi:hypothetical protein